MDVGVDDRERGVTIRWSGLCSPSQTGGGRSRQRNSRRLIDTCIRAIPWSIQLVVRERELVLADLVATDLGRVDLEAQAGPIGNAEKPRSRQLQRRGPRNRRRTSGRWARRRSGTCSWPAWPGGCRTPGRFRARAWSRPSRRCLLVAEVVDRPGRPQPPHALDLEIDDPAGAPADGLGGLLVGLGRLVEADRRGDRLLEPGQAVEVGRLHRLLEHEQVEVVELRGRCRGRRPCRHRWRRP